MIIRIFFISRRIPRVVSYPDPVYRPFKKCMHSESCWVIVLKVDDFLVERWMNEYEHNVEVNMAETCMQPFTLREFLKLVDHEDYLKELLDLPLTYGHIEGHPQLREGISKLYTHVDPENVLVTGGAIEANFNALYSLVEPGDTVISVFPTYQQLHSVAKGFGANVKRLYLRPENHWLPDVEELKELVDDKTRMIVLNNPNNPTGSLIDGDLMKAICDVAEDAGAYVLCDEAYRGLYIRDEWVPSVIHECKLHRDYTTISKGVLDEALAVLAVEHIDKILERNNVMVRRNHQLMDDWIRNEPKVDWIPPRAGSVGFMKHHLDLTAEEICLSLIREKSTFMVPGDCFEMPEYIRIGYGNNINILVEGLKRFKEFLSIQ